jgi:hypothetical protein
MNTHSYELINKTQIVRKLSKYPVRIKYLYYHTKIELYEILDKLEEGAKQNIPIQDTIKELNKTFSIHLLE